MKTTDMGSFGELLCNYLYISDLVGVFEKMSFLAISVDFVIYFPMQEVLVFENQPLTNLGTL